MANNETRLDDFDFSDLDMDRGSKSSLSGRDAAKDRGPILKLSTSFADGASEAFTRPEYIRRMASSALPKGYGTAINTGHDVYRGAAELYNIAAHELKPAMPAIRRATQRAMPKVRSFLPKRIADQLDAFSKKEEYRYRATSQSEYDDRTIEQELGGVIRTQMEYEAEQRAIDQTERRIRDEAGTQINRASLARLEAIQHALNRQVGFQDGQTSRYQRKMVELGFRQYFVLRDTLKYHTQAGDYSRRQLDAIVHNTALPDQVKLSLSEAAHSNFRERLLNSFQQQASSYVGTFSKKLMDNLKTTLRTTASSLAMGIQMSEDQTRQIEEMRAAGLIDEDDTQLAGRGAGSWAAEAVGRVASRKIRKALDKNKTVNGFGSRLQHGLGSIPERMNQWAQTEDDDWSAKGVFTRMLKELVPRFSLDTRFGSSPIMDADQPATFDSLTRRSITEIIPGFLSRIHHEIAMMRTGNDKIERLTYNQDRGEFTSHSQVVKDVKRRLFDPGAVGYARSNMASFLDSLDKDKELSPEARTALMRQILADTAAGRPFDPDRYSNFEQMTSELVGNNKEEVAKIFKRHFRTADGGLNYDAVNDARGKIGALRNAVPDPKKAMGVYSDVGYDDVLQELGLLVNKGVMNRVNYSKIWDLILEEAEESKDRPKDPKVGLREQMEEILDKKFDSAADSIGAAASGGMGGLRAGVGRLTSGIRDRVKTAQDRVQSVYVAGRASAVLDAARLKMGEYRDQLTGKILHSIDDIRGPVEDLTGRVVLSTEDIVAGITEEGGRRRRDIEDKVRSRIDTLQQTHLLQQPTGQAGTYTPEQTATMTDMQQQSQQERNRDLDDELIKLGTQQVELLKVIAEILATNGVAGNGGTPSPGGYLDRLVVGSLKKGWSGVRFASKLYGSYVMAVGRGVGAAFKGAASIATGATSTAFEILKGPLAGARDVYVKGNDYPSLTAAKMKRRHYQDVKSGKPVRNVKSITGPVVDISNNGEMVLTQEEFDRGLFVRTPNGFVRFGLSALKGGAMAIVGGYASLAKLPFMAISAGVRGLKTGVTMFFNDQIDVYVTGEMQQPRLRALMMKAGRYYSVRTGRLVRGFKDIDGPVNELPSGANRASPTDMEVLSIDDIKKGLVNARGKELRTGAQRALGVLGTVAGAAGRLAGWTARGYASLVGGVIRGAGALGGGVMNLFGNALAQFFPQSNRLGKFSKKKGDDPTEVLKDIYRLLDERMERPIKIREGSWQDQAAERAAKQKDSAAQKAAKKEADANKGMMSRFASWMSGQSDDDEEDGEESDDDGNTTIIAGGGGGGEGRTDNSRDAQGRKRGGFRRRTSSRWKRGKRWVGRSKLGRFAGAGWNMAKGVGGKLGLGRVGGAMGRFKPRGLGLGGIGAGVAMGVGGGYAIDKLGGSKTVAGRTASTAVDVGGTAMTGYSLASMAGLTGGSAVAATGGGAAASAAGTAGAAVGTGAAATIGLPVALIAGAVAAAGYAGVKSYKKYKYGSYVPLRSYRMAQYGIAYSDASQVQTIVELEQLLEPHTTQVGGGLDISAAKLRMEEIYKLFDLDDGWFSNNQDERNAFDLWFNHRFKPVYLAWKLKSNGIKSGTALNDADDALTQEEKSRLLKAVKGIALDVYKVSVGPFDGDKLEIGPSEVEAAYGQAAATIEKEKTTGGKALGKLDRFNVAIANLIPVPFATTMVEKSIEMRKRFWEQGTTNTRTGVGKLAAASGLATAKTAGGQLRGPPTPKAPAMPSNVSALSAIRLRAYGLTELDATLVRALQILEGDVIRDLTYGASGAAEIDQTPDYYFDSYCGYFGLASNDKAVRLRWTEWFEHRFAPVLLAFASSVRSMDQSVYPTEAESRMKPEELVEIAAALIGAKRLTFGFKLAIWSFSDSPWGKEPLNTDSHTVADNLLALKEAIKKRTLDETTSRAAGGRSSKSSAAAMQGSSTTAPAQSAWTDRVKSWMMGDKQNPTILAQALDQGRSVASTAAGAAGNMASGWMSGASTTGRSSAGSGPIGAAVVHPGNGTGGNINAIPMPTGDGSWGAMKDTILAASKMAGVSPDLMATMANIESNFRAGVKAGTSSATGLYQFITDTWSNMLRKYGAKYGLSPNASRTDPRANALMGAEFLKENIRYLKNKLKREPTDTEMYLAHFMGAGGAGQLLSADPNANAVALFPKQARANKPIFMNRDGSARTISGVLQELNRRVSSRRIAVSPGALNSVAIPKSGAPATGGITTTTANGVMGGLGPNAGATPAVQLPSFSGRWGSPSAPEAAPTKAGSFNMTAGKEGGANPVRIAAPAPVPMIAPSSLQASPAVGSAVNDEAFAQQRALAEQAARATDYRGQESSAAAQRQMTQVVDVLTKSHAVHVETAKGIANAVELLKRIEASSAAAAGRTETGKAEPRTTSTPGSARRTRAPEATPAEAPVSMKRGG